MTRWGLAVGWLIGCASVAVALYAEERLHAWRWEARARRAARLQGKADADSMVTVVGHDRFQARYAAALDDAYDVVTEKWTGRTFSVPGWPDERELGD